MICFTQDKFSFCLSCIYVYPKDDIIILSQKHGGSDMTIKASAALIKEHTEISEMTKKLRAKVLQAEQERIEGAETLSVSEARKRLRDRLNGI